MNPLTMAALFISHWEDGESLVHDGISSCTVGLCGPLHGGYQDNILEDSILGQHLRGQHLRTVS
jgi:hypothetical protein